MKREKFFAKKSVDNKIRFPIKNKIMLLSAMAALPFLIMVVYLLVSMTNYSRAYDDIVRNLTIANNYNLDFKEEMDESLYKLVVGYVTFDNISEKDTLKDPYVMIDELRSEFTKLMDITTEAESRVWLESLLRNIDTLQKRVDDIVENVSDGERYDENIEELDNNIYILTELIQDDIQYYIYYQTQSMEEVTSNLNRQMDDFIVICIVLVVLLVAAVAVATVLMTSCEAPISLAISKTEITPTMQPANWDRMIGSSCFLIVSSCRYRGTPRATTAGFSQNSIKCPP